MPSPGIEATLHNRVTLTVRVTGPQAGQVAAGIDDEQAAGAGLFPLQGFAGQFVALDQLLVVWHRGEVGAAFLQLLGGLLQLLLIQRAVEFQHQQAVAIQLPAVAPHAFVIELLGHLEAQCAHLLGAELTQAVIAVVVGFAVGPAVDQVQGDAAVVLAPVGVAVAQLALGHLQAAVGRLAAVPGHPGEGDGVDQHNQAEAGEQAMAVAPVHCGCPPSKPLALRSRRRISRINTALRPSRRKNRYLGMLCHHQSNSLV